MKIRLFAGAVAVAASLFVAQSSVGAAAERLVLTPAQMDAVAAGLSIDLDSRAKAVGARTQTNTGAHVILANKRGVGVGVAVAGSDQSNGASASIGADATGDEVKINRKTRISRGGNIKVETVRVHVKNK